MKTFGSFVFIISAVILSGCSKQSNFNQNIDQSSLTLEKPQDLSQIIVLSNSDNDLNDFEIKLPSLGGLILRKMEFKKGYVAQIPSQALPGLKIKFTNLKIIEDVKMNLINPIDIQCKESCQAGRQGGSGGGTVTQPSQQIPWGISTVHADSAHTINRGLGSKVCIVDTGVAKLHPDLKENIVGGRNFIFKRGKVDPVAWEDDNGHGTHVSGIVAALDNGIGTIGVAPLAKIYAVKVLDRNGSGSFSAVIDGIKECVSASANVINMSLGAAVSPTSDTGILMQEAVDFARNAGLEIAVAGGNEGADMNQTIPAGLNNLIAVSAVDVNLTFPSWSNFGLSLEDFAAPGVSIYSTWIGDSYNTISGTSMASPHVAGVLALKYSSQSSLIGTSDIGFPISKQGAGLIDALKTVQINP